MTKTCRTCYWKGVDPPCLSPHGCDYEAITEDWLKTLVEVCGVPCECFEKVGELYRWKGED